MNHFFYKHVLLETTNFSYGQTDFLINLTSSKLFSGFRRQKKNSASKKHFETLQHFQHPFIINRQNSNRLLTKQITLLGFLCSSDNNVQNYPNKNILYRSRRIVLYIERGTVRLGKIWKILSYIKKTFYWGSFKLNSVIRTSPIKQGEHTVIIFMSFVVICESKGNTSPTSGVSLWRKLVDLTC